MTVSSLPRARSAITRAIESEWCMCARHDLAEIDFRDWPRGFHRSAWVVAGYIVWNPLDVLDKPTPAARAVNALLTRHCAQFVVAMIRHTSNPRDLAEPLLAWFNAAASEYQHDIAGIIEDVGGVALDLPISSRWAARRLVKMWETGGISAFEGLSSALTQRAITL
jgi:hypothetical protein